MKTEIRKRLAQLEKEGKTIDYQLGFLEGALFAIAEADKILNPKPKPKVKIIPIFKNKKGETITEKEWLRNQRRRK